MTKKEGMHVTLHLEKFKLCLQIVTVSTRILKPRQIQVTKYSLSIVLYVPPSLVYQLLVESY